MPTPISGNPLNYPASSTLPDDSATSVSQFNVPYGALFDRTAWANAALSPLATIAALKALDTTPIADGTVRLVDGFGFYVLRTASALAELQPWIVDPTTGPGRWLHVMNASKPTFKTQTFTTSGTFVLPDTAASADVILIGYGGGGGGGAGCKSITTPGGANWGAGGGGGGGAQQSVARVTLTPGTSYTVTIGAGGAGGVGGLVPSANLHGQPGGDTTLKLGATLLALFAGGGGGMLGGTASTTAGGAFGPGGPSVRGAAPPSNDPSSTAWNRLPIMYWQASAGAGGAGNSADEFWTHAGALSLQGFGGGAPGGAGADSGSWKGGGPGGGGGGGPTGNGGNGANGGNGSSGSAATPGAVGASASANTGAGGGGGGAAGAQASGTGPAGGNGGAGGSGKLTIIWIGA